MFGSLGFEVFEPKMPFLHVLGELLLATASKKEHNQCSARLQLA
jgi:hypothetical protein